MWLKNFILFFLLLFYIKNVIINIKNRGGILEFIISFFRDFLSGPVYIVVVVISVIGILACIGYLAEFTLKQREEQKKYEQMYSGVHILPTDDATGFSMVSNAETAISTAQLDHVGDVSATNIAQTTTSTDTSNTEDVLVTPSEILDSSNTPEQKQ